MTMESNTNTKYNLRDRSELKKKMVSDNDSSSSSDEDYQDPVYHDDDDDMQDFDDAAFKEFLYKMFPSKHTKQKVKEMDAITKKMDAVDEKKNQQMAKSTKTSKKSPKSSKSPRSSKSPKSVKSLKNAIQRKKPATIIEESETDSDSDNSSSDSDEDYSDDEYEAEPEVISIVLKLEDFLDEFGSEIDDTDYDSDSESDSESENENESDRKSNHESKRNSKANEISKKQEKTTVSTNEANVSKKSSSSTKPSLADVKKEKELLEKIEKAFALVSEDQQDSYVFNELKQFTKAQREMVEKEDKKLNKKSKDKNMREFRKLLHDRKSNNEVAYFNSLPINEQNCIIKKMKESNKLTSITKPYRFKLLDMTLPDHVKAVAMKKMTTFQKMEPDSSEYFKMKNWIDAFMSIPFNTYKNFDISLQKDGPDKCREFMTNTSKIMDGAVYGLNDAKMQIMQMIGTWISNPEAVGNAIAIKGPPGTGKTTLVKEGVSKVLNRPFAFIALGGSTDSSFLEGHGYTYEGSTWGKIVSILMESKCMNPVIYFDELDKVSDTPKGEEIIGILTHLIDTSQNSEFHDKYFSEINFDLSKCLFIFSYNDESKINPILRDRMYRITTKGYSKKDKNVIAKNYLLPTICKQVNFPQDSVIIEDDVIDYIVENFTEKEDGVRNFKRCLEIIYTKLNLYRLMPEDSDLFKNEKPFKVEFPFTVTSKIIDKLIKREQVNDNWKVMYM